MNYKQYHKSDLFVTPAGKTYKHRRYIEDNRNRLIQFIEGNLTEILPQDFDTLTYLPDSTLYYDPLILALSSLSGSGNEMEPFDNIKLIEISDKITQIGNSRDTHTLMPSIQNVTNLEIIFPKNLSTIYGVIPIGEKIILNFSKATKVPTWYYTEGSSPSSEQGTIKVPSSLYNTWINATTWSSVANIITAV